MMSYLLAGPAEEPVSLARAKGHLRVEDDAEDGLIEGLVTAARIHIESVTGRALIAQTWRIILDAWPTDRVIHMPVSPVIALSGVRAIDPNGTATEIETDQFTVETNVSPARLFVPETITGMPQLRKRRGIEIEFDAGFGQEAADVPGDLCQALLTLVGNWYENRDGLVPGAMPFSPAGLDRLVSPYKRVRL